MKKLLIVFLLIIISKFSFSQTNVDSILEAGSNFYKMKNYANAAKLFEQAALYSDSKISKRDYYYYAATSYASAKDSTNSFKLLELAVQFSYNDALALKDDDAFKFMHDSKRWKSLMNSIKPSYTGDPLKAKVIDTDVKNFWSAYDMVKNDTSQAKEIYENYYFNKGTIALEFYYINKIGSLENFLLMHKLHEKYYASIRKNTLRAAQQRNEYVKSFVKLKNIYPAAKFPPIYFVIGKLRSAGTVSSDGLILGIDQACMSPDADTTELSTWEKHNISTFKNLPHTVAHELVHYQQNGMASDTTLLKEAILEGMADFIGELISGKSANERLLIFAKGKEKKIWDDFKKDMYFDRKYNWIANSDQETPDKPADLGYWAGYQICKAYYEEAKDKKQAVYDMLHIQDYKKFLEMSKLDEKIK
ncbi:MAG TPA: DUF2268 domain-containing putative Zn-dependent protease [Puia sp.]|nr:DUF2268 domain-containing putative Zn-dependent protease [Puia sp.]